MRAKQLSKEKSIHKREGVREQRSPKQWIKALRLDDKW